MSIGIVLFLGMIVTGIPMGILIDHIAGKYELPMQDGMSPAPWAVLGLVWPVTFLPFLVYCLCKNKNRDESDYFTGR